MITLRAHAREDLRYGLCRLLSSSSLRCDCSLTQYASHDSIGSMPRADSDWLVRFGLDNARISSRISASRSGGSGDTLINVRDATELKLCLPYSLFLIHKATIRSIRERQTIPLQRPQSTTQRSTCMCIGFLPDRRLTDARVVRRLRLCRTASREWRNFRSTVEPALPTGSIAPEISRYSRAREYAESGSAVSKFLMTVLR